MKKTTRRRKPSLGDAAYTIIKHKVVTLELAPGAIVDEQGLRVSLGLGRTPIREALQRLSREKLIKIVPRQGTFVTDIDPFDLQRISEVRLVLEPLAARLASQRATASHWQQMSDILCDLSEDSEITHDMLIEIDEICHLVLYEATDNKFLADTLETLYALSLRLWYYSLPKIGDMQHAVLGHKRILNALKERDAELAAALVKQHIMAFYDEIKMVMQEQIPTQ